VARRPAGVISIVGLVLAIGLAVPLAMWVLQERLIFLPQPLSDARRSEIRSRYPAVREIVEVRDGVKLHAWHVPAAPGAPVVLYFGGNAEDVSWMIEDALTRAPGVGWLLVSYRGYGASEGSPSEATITADALAWHDYAMHELRPERLLVFGRSLGGGAATFVASERAVAGVILVTPFDSLVEVAKRHYPFLPVALMLRHPFDSIGRAPKIAAPLLCIAAARDEVVPAAHARRLYEAWGGPKRWIELEGAGHNDTDSAALFWPSLTAFLRQPTGSR
jgi:pimeloyl-ACP methyl ester carboxylesterase